MKHCGFTAVVKVIGNVKKQKSLRQDIEINDQPEGGANALNINRYLLVSVSFAPTSVSDFNITKMEILMRSSAFDLSGVSISSFHIKMGDMLFLYKCKH